MWGVGIVNAPRRARNRGRGAKCAYNRRRRVPAAFCSALPVAAGKGTVAVARKGQAGNPNFFICLNEPIGRKPGVMGLLTSSPALGF